MNKRNEENNHQEELLTSKTKKAWKKPEAKVLNHDLTMSGTVGNVTEGPSYYITTS